MSLGGQFLISPDNSGQNACREGHERQSAGSRLIAATAAIAMRGVTACPACYYSHTAPKVQFGLYEVGHRQPSQQNRPQITLQLPLQSVLCPLLLSLICRREHGPSIE